MCKFKVIVSTLLAALALLSPVFAGADDGVSVDMASINQSVDEETRTLAIYGKLSNRLAVGIRDVRVKLFIPAANSPGAKTWEINAGSIPASSSDTFVFRIRLAEVLMQETFSVLVSEYDLDLSDVPTALKLAQEASPSLLRAIVRTLASEARAHPTRVAGAFVAANSLGRLCVAEAVVSGGQPSALQFLAEQLLSGQDFVDQRPLLQANLAAMLRDEPGPFPLLTQWKQSGNRIDYARNLLELSRTGGLAATIRMLATGTTFESKRFASETLQLLGMESIDRQLANPNKAARAELPALYQELAHMFPSEPQYRRDLGMADWKLNRLLILLALASTIVVPAVATILGSREPVGEEAAIPDLINVS